MAHGLTTSLARSLLDIEPTALLEFYLIYYNWPENEDDFLSLHAGQNGVNTKIIWQGIQYSPYNIQSSNWEIKGDSTTPRPHLIVPNKGFLVSSMLRKYDNLNGCKVVRKRTFVKFLDDENFPDNENPYGAADPNAGFADEKFYISQVVSENKSQVEFELVSPLELENIKIPNRRIHSSFCPFIYRGHGCRYNGHPIADVSDKIYVIEGDSIDQFNILAIDAENYDNVGISDNSKVHRGTYYPQSGAGGGGITLDTVIDDDCSTDNTANWYALDEGGETLTLTYVAGQPAYQANPDSFTSYFIHDTLSLTDAQGYYWEYEAKLVAGSASVSVIRAPHSGWGGGYDTYSIRGATSVTSDYQKWSGVFTVDYASKPHCTGFGFGIQSAFDGAYFKNLLLQESGSGVLGDVLFSGTGLYSGLISNTYPSGITSPVIRGSYAIDLNDGGILIAPSGDYSSPVYNDFTQSSNSNQFTLMSWVYPLSGNGDSFVGGRQFQTVFDMGDATGGFVVRYVSSNGTSPHKIQAEFKNVSGTNDITSFVSDDNVQYNDWQHIAVTFDKGEVILYENALVAASGYVTGDDANPISKIVTSLGAHGFGMTFFDHAGTGGDLGTNGYETYNHFSGYMDDIRIYRGVAIQPEIDNIYSLQHIGYFSNYQLNDRGKYDSTATYNRGDTVFVEGKKYKMLSKDTKDGFVGIKIEFICLNNGTTTDPRNDSTNWVRDACGKRQISCAIRHGRDGILPFGGFPGTQKYPFQSTSNGY